MQKKVLICALYALINRQFTSNIHAVTITSWSALESHQTIITTFPITHCPDLSSLIAFTVPVSHYLLVFVYLDHVHSFTHCEVLYVSE